MTVQEDLEMLRGAGKVMRRWGIDPSVTVDTAEHLLHDNTIAHMIEQLKFASQRLHEADQELRMLDLSLLTTNRAAEIAGALAHVEKAHETINNLDLRSPITLCKEA